MSGAPGLNLSRNLSHDRVLSSGGSLVPCVQVF